MSSAVCVAHPRGRRQGWRREPRPLARGAGARGARAGAMASRSLPAHIWKHFRSAWPQLPERTRHMYTQWQKYHCVWRRKRRNLARTMETKSQAHQEAPQRCLDHVKRTSIKLKAASEPAKNTQTTIAR